MSEVELVDGLAAIQRAMGDLQDRRHQAVKAGTQRLVHRLHSEIIAKMRERDNLLLKRGEAAAFSPHTGRLVSVRDYSRKGQRRVPTFRALMGEFLVKRNREISLS